MEVFTTLKTSFTKSEIEEIYKHLVEYSIINYERNPIEILKKRYESALEVEGIEEINKTFDEIEIYLLEKQQKYKEIISSNKDLIDCVAHSIIHILNEDIKKLTTNEEKLSYIFDFVTSTISYDKEYAKYLHEIPLTNGITFNFKGTIPNDGEVFTTLVLGEGLSDEICNLIVYLARVWNIPVGKMYVDYKGKRHAINYLSVKEEISLIDATRKIINKEEKKHKCFLVSANKLNRENNYVFNDEETIESFTVGEDEYKYENCNVKDTTEHVKRILPKVKYQKEIQQTKIKTLN